MQKIRVSYDRTFSTKVQFGTVLSTRKLLKFHCSIYIMSKVLSIIFLIEIKQLTVGKKILELIHVFLC
jgi:hypothetical protein